VKRFPTLGVLVYLPILLSFLLVTLLLPSYLENRNRWDDSPVWSPDGTKIAFVKTDISSDRDGYSEIHVMNADGSNQTRLTKNSIEDKGPNWSPDGSKIVFSSGNDIYVMIADGSNQIKLTDSPGGNSTPAWSPDGTKIAFSSGRDGNYEIYVMDADGGNQTKLTDNPTDDIGPQWSPDGSKIVFTSGNDIYVNIYVMNADGSNQTRLTNNNKPNSSSEPAWSPDGTKIAFTQRNTSFYAHYSAIFVIDADGSNQTRLTNNDNESDLPAWSPEWSPDGSKIAFTSYHDDNFEIYVMNADGSNPSRLIDSSSSPVWSPDGSKIVFTFTANSGSESMAEILEYRTEIYVMNADGSNPTMLSDVLLHVLEVLIPLTLIPIFVAILIILLVVLQRRQLLGKGRTSIYGVLSLVLGLAGFFSASFIIWFSSPLEFISPLAAVVAITFGAVGIGRISRNPNLRGKDIAKAGLLFGIGDLILWVIISIIVFLSLPTIPLP
jgi:Tol biopolymer transport system component